MCANCKLNFKQYLKVEKFLVEEDYNLIEEHDFFNNCRLMVINFVGLGWFVWGCGWGRELELQSGKVLHRIRVQFFHELLCFGLVHVGFVLGG